MNTKTSILLQLGPVKNNQDWCDYLKYGFTDSDVDELMAIVTDEPLNNGPGDSEEVWAPLHAWRALGQIRSPLAVQPLIDNFDILNEDDWALCELSTVMSMIGEPAIEALAMYINESGHEEFARVIATDSLTEIAKQYPQCRDKVLEIFRKHMDDLQTTHDTFNGLLVCSLLELNAVEMIDDIRQIYDQGYVDISCAGDIEDVEISLGLRSERSTPKPDYYPVIAEDAPPVEEMLYEMPCVEEDALNALHEKIAACLELYGHDDSILDISELDGYFAALACSPETLLPSKWMPLLWGGDELSPEWESIDETMQFTENLMAFYNQAMQDFLENKYEPLYLEGIIEGRSITIVTQWCEGFVRGLRLWGHLALQDMAALEKCLYPIRLFTTDEGIEALNNMSDQEIIAEQNNIEPEVNRLYRHFLKIRSQSGKTIVRETPKVGRNDLCPCGSGKKFKRCCLH